MGDLDEASRYGLKLTPGEQVGWCVADLDPDLGFARWLDTLTIAFPGEPERRCDTVAELVSRSGTQPPWALVLEAQADPAKMTTGRFFEYEGRFLRALRHGPHGRDVYRVAGVVIFLKGVRGDLVVEGYLPGTNLGGLRRYRAWCLEALDAAATLAQIERGELGRSILLWVPLMRGADRPGVVAHWLRLIAREPDKVRRAEYAGLALIFASWRGLQALWQPALEGFDVEQIEIVRTWKDNARREGRQEGQEETQRSNLRKVLGQRFPGQVPAPVAQAIQQTHDLDLLTRWFDLALSGTWEEFQVAVLAAPAAANGTAKN